MFYIRTALTNIIRYKSKSILNLLICSVVVILLNLFIGSLESNKQQLANLPEVIPISAQISSLNGEQQTGLIIREDKVDALLQSKYISDLAITVVLVAGEGESPKDNLRSFLTIDVAGITNLKAISGLTEQDITLAPDTSLTFLQSDTPVCLVQEEFLNKNNWKIGQTITLTMYYDYLNKNSEYVMEQLKTEEFYIAGSIEKREDVYPPQVIIPLQWAKEASKSVNIPFIANAASFRIKNPLQINAFKKEMKEELHMLPINPAGDFSHSGDALAVNDATFILSASRIQDNIGLLSVFLPFVLCIIVFIGYITSYLLIQNRRGQYATMRSLGVGSSLCFFILFLESIIIELIGGTIGIIITIILTKQSWIILVITFLIFMFCYIGGTTVALYQLGKISVMKALAQKD